MPESKRRKKDSTAYVPEMPKGERKVAKLGSPAWLAPTMVACFCIGLLYIVAGFVGALLAVTACSGPGSADDPAPAATPGCASRPTARPPMSMCAASPNSSKVIRAAA